MLSQKERKLALITGGTSGIGFGVAKRLSSDWDLALVYGADEEKARAAEIELLARQPGLKLRTYKMPLSGETNFPEMISSISTDFGCAPAALIHSAGRLGDDLMLRADLMKIRRVLDEHLFVAMALSQAALKTMYRDRFGRIVFMSSISSFFSKRGQGAYAAAKAGLEGFTRTLALEVAHRGVTVNAIAPGLIETPMTRELVQKLNQSEVNVNKRIPAGRMGQPEEVGALARFLCSEDASYITGTVVTIDGGRSLGDPLS